MAFYIAARFPHDVVYVQASSVADAIRLFEGSLNRYLESIGGAQRSFEDEQLTGLIAFLLADAEMDEFDIEATDDQEAFDLFMDGVRSSDGRMSEWSAP